MSDSNFSHSARAAISRGEIGDVSIQCIDCNDSFTWTAGEQAFFLEKDLLNPPKRCKDCKRAKNRRLAAIEMAQMTGRPPRIEVAAQCAQCGERTTVPFYPSQGRPVFCRTCFDKQKIGSVVEANGNI